MTTQKEGQHAGVAMGAGGRGDRKPRSVFRNLRNWMLSFGVFVGIIFPFFAKVVLETDRALTPTFIALCVVAGLIVGFVNFLLFHFVVSKEISTLVEGMEFIIDGVRGSSSHELECAGYQIPVKSSDAIGEMARGFNEMSQSICQRIKEETFSKALLTKLSRSVDIKEISDSILESLLMIFGSKVGLLYGTSDGEMEFLSMIGLDKSEDLPRTIGEAHGPVSQAMKSGDVLSLSIGEGSFNWFHLSTPLGVLRPEAIVIIPFMVEKRPAGLAIIAGNDVNLTHEQEMFLAAIRSSAAPYIQNAILHDRVQRLAAVDDLTQILNRRFGLQRLREEFARSVRHGVPVSAIISDVDHFKRFNDTYGHDAGDAVLKMVAKEMERNVRAGDVLCRYGGEEFLIVAPGTGLQDATQLAERIRRKVEATKITWRGQELDVRISAGISTWPITHASVPEEVITDADRALYFAKQNGRNLVAANTGQAIERAADLLRDG